MERNSQTQNEDVSHSSEGQGSSPIWRKLFSSNWWWYGEVNPDPATLPPPEKRPRFWRAHVWIVFVFWLLVLVAPVISSLMNFDIPQQQDLLTLRGDVIATSERSPHMQIRLASGEVIDAEFPVRVTYFRGVKTELFKEPVHKLVLTCKQVVVSGTYLRFMPASRFRIWDFSCVNGAFFVPLNEIKKKWLSSRLTMHVYVATVCWGAFLLILFAYFYRERKDHVFKN